MQLRWDLWITEYWVRLGLPWSMLDQPAHKEFWAKENPKYHCKNSTTYSRAKLPLLYDQVKAAVETKIKRDLPHTTGVAFTADHWTSRSMDPSLPWSDFAYGQQELGFGKVNAIFLSFKVEQ